MSVFFGGDDGWGFGVMVITSIQPPLWGLYYIVEVLLGYFVRDGSLTVLGGYTALAIDFA